MSALTLERGALRRIAMIAIGIYLAILAAF